MTRAGISLRFYTKRKAFFKHSWRSYTVRSTISSVKYFWSKYSPATRTFRILWIILASWSFICGLLITRTQWLLYLDGQVVNRIKIENASIINFPAISICNQMVTKRIIGCHWPGYNQFSRYYSLTSQIEGGPKWTTEMEKENEEYCQCPKDHVKPPLAETLRNIAKDSYYETLFKFSPSVNDSYVYCKLNGMQRNCIDLFADRFTDIGLCATFNMVYVDGISDHRNRFDEFIALNKASKNQNYSIQRPGLSSSLQVVLKAGKSEYCGSLRKWYGEGFHYAIHRPTNIIPLHFLSDFKLKFDPGYVFNIALKVTNIIRHTEHMGRCTKKRWEITGLTETPFPYDKAVCLINCLFRLTYTKCGCISLLYENMMNVINEQNTDIKDVNISMPLCREKSETKLCEYKQIATWRTDEYVVNNCTNCPPTCIESDYSATVTRTKLYGIPNGLDEFGELKLEELIVANFYVQSMTVTNIHEEQAFTFIDLLIYTGGIFSLFFGLSFMTLWEVFFELIMWMGHTVSSSFGSIMCIVKHGQCLSTRGLRL